MNSLDYVLLLVAVLPPITLILWIGPRIIVLVYEVASVLVGWPMM